MLFNSYDFIFKFLPVFLVLYSISALFLSQLKSNLVLIVGSLYFYAFANPADLLIIVLSILGNYTLTISLIKFPNLRKPILICGVVANLSVLFCYKYLNFMISIVNHIPGVSFSVVSTHLPLAISFFTFQQISFIVDRYRSKQTIPIDFNKYAAAVLFFPHLIAGPLVEYKKLIPQFSRPMRFSRWGANIYLGLVIFVLGLSKKMILADSLNPLVDLVFAPQVHLADVSWLDSFVATWAYTFQLYFDFSGYSDMAVGLGLMFGITLPFNFNSPYKATSIVDFWRRWHISLSNFLKNYLYIPLGGSRLGEYKHFRNLFLTMLIGGIWHGAGWHFVIWGAWHGGLICLVHFFRKTCPNLVGKYFRFNIVNQVLTLVCVMFGWIFFRADNHQIAWQIITKIFHVRTFNLNWPFTEFLSRFSLSALVLVAAAGVAFFMPNTILVLRFYKYILFKKRNIYLMVFTSLGLAFLLNICLLLMSKPVTFLYYQF